jgi:uncharacterized protein
MQELNQVTEEPIVKEPIKKQARIWGMLCHLTALLGLIGIPFGHIIGPLIVWLFKKKAYPFVDKQGKESLNFQISMTLYAIIAALMIYIKLGMLPLWILAAINLLLVFIAAVRANSGEIYRYPFTIRLIK